MNSPTNGASPGGLKRTHSVTAAVVGAGPGGLAAACAISNRYGRVYFLIADRPLSNVGMT
jgi:threonine dehydrogenase-like Zn-dependent dehydrogenase